MIWLGERRGNLSDWVTQQWVRATGRRLDLARYSWLDGPVGGTTRIGEDFFHQYAGRNDLSLVDPGVRGLIPSFTLLERDNPALLTVSPQVKEFYESTSEFDLDAWSEWHPLFRPFGSALGTIFSQRLQQLNVPLSSLDSSRGMSSAVLQLRNTVTDEVVQTAWVRKLFATQNILYAGSYSICNVPGHPTPCVKVVFPLPNGNAIVLMKAERNEDGSLSVRSIGQCFGEPGFYFVVHNGDGTVWARYVASMKEEIRVYHDETSTVHADHMLWLWGVRFLRLHYRMSKRGATSREKLS